MSDKPSNPNVEHGPTMPGRSKFIIGGIAVTAVLLFSLVVSGKMTCSTCAASGKNPVGGATVSPMRIGVIGASGLWGLVVPLFLFASTTGLIVANSITGATADFPQRAGAVSALTGAVQYGSGIFGSGLVGLFADGTPWPMGSVIAICGIGSLLSMRLLMPVPRRDYESGLPVSLEFTGLNQ